ncbi:MAG: hypothetical protein FJ290_03745 [Planctomycetes bacterium]|nr:hypothetical protein [Planctomycetota bacterium]
MSYFVSVAESQDCLKAGLQTRNERVRSPGFSQSLASEHGPSSANSAFRNRNYFGKVSSAANCLSAWLDVRDLLA